MYTDRPTRNSKGEIIHQTLQSRTAEPGRIEPHLRWFENTRVTTQEQMQDFREKMKETMNPWNVILHSKKVPWGLITDSTKVILFDIISY
jgi:nuclear GTP-binding protein